MKSQTVERIRKLAYLYLRVSTVEQATEGASLDAQREALVAEATRRGWDYEIVADEGFSAKTIKGRPALMSALTRLDAGEADVLLALRVDRLSRSVSDFANTIERSRKRKWSLVALDLGVDTSTPAGDLMANVLVAVAQYERLLIGQRTREGMAAKRAKGKHMGRVRSLDESTVRLIVGESQRGHGLSEIAARLIADGVPTARGGIWHPATVRRVLEGTTARRMQSESWNETGGTRT